MRKINGLLKPASMALLPLCTSLAFLPAHAQTAAPAATPAATPAAAPVVKYDLTYDIISPVQAKNGMVASEQELAERFFGGPEDQEVIRADVATFADMAQSPRRVRMTEWRFGEEPAP